MTNKPIPEKELSYEEALRICDCEALSTMGVALFLALFFWAMIVWLGDSTAGWWGLPFWFWASCICGYVLSVVLTYWLVRRVFRSIDLEKVAPEESSSQNTSLPKV